MNKVVPSLAKSKATIKVVRACCKLQGTLIVIHISLNTGVQLTNTKIDLRKHDVPAYLVRPKYITVTSFLCTLSNNDLCSNHSHFVVSSRPSTGI